MLWINKKSLDKNNREQLATASTELHECLKKDFFTPFMAGKDVNIEHVCVNQRKQVEALNKMLGQSATL